MALRTHFLIPLVGIATALTSWQANAAYDSADSANIKTLEIIRVTPDGDDAYAGKQLVIQFNRPVVPIGKMERNASEIPVIISPALNCEWRWINTSALSCNLSDKDPMKEATHYQVDIKPGIKTEDGTTIAETYHHNFTTKLPAISYKQFVHWKSPSLPVLRLVFNQPVEKDSVMRHIFFKVGSSGNRAGIRVKPDPEDRTLPRFMPVPGENYGLLFKKSVRQKSDDDLHRQNGKEARRIWLVEPREAFPLDTSITLSTEPGILSALGAEPGVDTEEIIKFDTYPEFKFLGVKCRTNEMNDLVIAPGEESQGKCNPQQPIELSFSAPVDGEWLKKIKFTPPIYASKEALEEEGSIDESEDSEGTVGNQYRYPHEKGKTYGAYLPGGLKAAQVYAGQSQWRTMRWSQRFGHWLRSLFKKNADTTEVTDVFGRTLITPVSTLFTTDHRNPNYVLDYNDAVLEKNVDSEVPLFVNNLDQFSFDYVRTNLKGNADKLTYTQKVPTVRDIQFAVPLGVREMLGGKTGAIFGYLSTNPIVDKYTKPHLFAQVTPYQVHVKLGHYNTLVWVTDMATGNPVSDAKVTLYKGSFTELNLLQKTDNASTTNPLGTALLAGTDMLDADLSFTRGHYKESDSYYFVRVEKGNDMALLPINDSFMIDAWRASGSETVYPDNKERYGHMHAWGTTAQGIYRAGDTIQYKIFVRDQNNTGFITPPLKGYRLKIIDPTGKVVDDQKEVTLSAFGGTNGEFTVPKEGAVGWYQFKLIAKFATQSGSSDESYDESASEETEEDEDSTGKKSFVPMRVLVSDFTPASFHVSNQLNGDLFHADQKVEVTTHAELHSGGAYTDASARITAVLNSAPFISKNPLTKNFQFDSYQYETDSQQIYQKIDEVGDKGELALDFNTGQPKVVFGKLMVESAVADDRGKYITGQSRADYVGVDRLVGLHNKDWLYQVGKPATLEYVVVDDHGAPKKGTEVNIALEHEVTKAARVKGAGNTYTTQYHTEWEAAGTCKATSTDAPLNCEVTPKKAGVYRATAKIKDTKGLDHSTITTAYATGHDFVVWNDESDNGLTIVPESTGYKVGDKARYLVKNPYPGTKALITIERYGVIDQFVQNFDSSTPVIEFPIKPDYIPGFYLSVVIQSPRVEKPLGEGQVDLGKPTFRMGYVTVPVNDKTKEMVVTAKTENPVYKPRDKVSVTLHAEPRLKSSKEPIEFTVAVLDESVFDLITGGKGYFDPYAGFYKLESLDLRNYSLLTRLIGRQKFEKKGANPGGDGGADVSMRSLFKFVSYWNAQLKADQNGDAQITFDAPDNLTGWRVLAIATTPTDRFGLGDANFKVNRPTEIRPVMPNQVMEGDEFKAGFSVMNRTDKPRTIEVSAQTEGNVDAASPLTMKQTVTLQPYKRTIVYMPIKAGILPQIRELNTGDIAFKITAGDMSDHDGLEAHVPVHKRRGLEVAANYGTTIKDSITESIQFPKDMLPDTGSVSIVASPTVIGNITGAFGYMRDYAYSCWEQKLSKGVMASHYKALKTYLPDTFTWKDSDILPQQTLDVATAFQAPNGGMTYFLAQDQYVDPYLSAYTAIAFNWLRDNGYKIPEQVEMRLQTYLSNLLKDNTVPDFYSESMTSTVRAVALDALAERGKADLADLERYQPHVKKMSLLGKSYFLKAALAIKGGAKYAPDVAKLMLASSNETGGKFIFNETWDDSYSRILASPLRENCAVLDAFTTYGETADGSKLVGDVPFKLVRAITQDRKNRDHWENTQENMFCANALIHFARVYEKDKPNMKVKASMDNSSFGETSFTDVRNPSVTLERPIKEGDAGRTTPVTIERQGLGRLYYATRLAYALPFDKQKPANAGMELHREYSVERDGKWILLKAGDPIKRGELVRVDLYLSVPAARNFVVLDDAVAGGFEPVNRDLATTSIVDANKAEFKAAGGAFWFKYSDWIDFGVSRWNFYHQEIRHDSVRFYSDYLPAGNYHLSYAAQAIASGKFSAMPAKAEEMYDPDVFGKTEGVTINVNDAEPAPAAKH